MFSARLTGNNSGNSRGITLSRKSFYEFTPNQSVARYLENNYQSGHNLELFDNIKSSNTSENITKKIDTTLGLKLFPNFSKQVLDDLRIVNSNINKNLLTNNNNDITRITAGYSTHYREQDKTLEQYGFENKLQSLFGVVDKKYSTNSRIGFGLNYLRSDAEYDEDNKRTYNLIHILTPFIYHNSLYQFISTPRIGFLWGNYERRANNKSYHADTQEYYYGITNELRQNIALEKFILEPKLELNLTGLYTSSIKEAYGLNIKGYNDISAELGFGLYASKDFEFDNNSILKVRVGGSTYFELLNPYQRMSGHLSGMIGEYKFNKTSHSKNRSVLNTSVKYQHGDINLIGELNKYIEDTDGYEVNMQYHHKL